MMNFHTDKVIFDIMLKITICDKSMLFYIFSIECLYFDDGMVQKAIFSKNNIGPIQRMVTFTQQFDSLVTYFQPVC